jgi:hypothetical protein
MMAAPIHTIAIIGAGNGGCAAAALLTQRGFDVRLYGRSRSTTEPLAAIGGVEYEGALGEGFAKITTITNDAGEAIAGADLVLIMAPTHAHEDVARTVARIRRATGDGSASLLSFRCDPPARQTSASAATRRPALSAARTVGRIRTRALGSLFAAFPGPPRRDRRPHRAVLPDQPRPSLSHGVPHQCRSPSAALLLNVGRVGSTSGDYHRYGSITPSVSRLIGARPERIAVASALGVEIERCQFLLR